MHRHATDVRVYGAHPDQWLRANGDPAASVCICFVHGGYWRPRYTAQLMEPLMDRLTDDPAVATVNIEYRREGDAEAMQNDVRSALRLTRELFPRAMRVVVGHSAGGHLALVTADEVELVVALAAVTDLTGGYAAGIGSGAVAALLGGSPTERPAAYAAATPRPPAVPALLVHGADDAAVPVSHSRGFARSAEAAGAPVEYRECAHLDHMLLIDPDGPHWPDTWAWVDRHVTDSRKERP
ncbi:alpha/beta hydrolase family protein [Microbacterium trichothecenolyticum]|uniref:Acetyl esterase/lipase n=1 Tax=Microbacterium trichothecenolyticum TaxID=69370 RepID=A0ABU0TSW3_MICTR|nr:alpha/beta hydrolase fold domain-containing protein [Microbacterium trichothecenolyticum]MDQ1122012.1 acetyl esterase/lipase [Microbacterium trichothecenolyticum]